MDLPDKKTDAEANSRMLECSVSRAPLARSPIPTLGTPAYRALARRALPLAAPHLATHYSRVPCLARTLTLDATGTN
ncbi:hypothetical protein QQP08_018730 [Theobroma cacao]|nr:hypothetical protein QQP08_018730 [Theobroma cacao]